MKQRDIQGKTRDELTRLLNELREKLLQLRFDLTDKKLKDSSQIRKVRRDIARVLTALHS